MKSSAFALHLFLLMRGPNTRRRLRKKDVVSFSRRERKWVGICVVVSKRLLVEVKGWCWKMEPESVNRICTHGMGGSCLLLVSFDSEGDMYVLRACLTLG